MSRPAKITQLWTGEGKVIAELLVEFTDAEVDQWRMARIQRHAAMASHPVSGQWARMPVA